MATSVPELVAFQRGDQNTFSTLLNPVRMGNAADIAYGGCAMAFAVNAATSTVATETHHIYSVLGHFLSGAKADRRLDATVQRIRDTSAFATRSVLVSQLQDDGSVRAVLSVQIDYHRRESGSLLSYSVPPPELATSVSQSWDRDRTRKEMTSIKGFSNAHAKMLDTAFEPAFRFFEQRAVPASIATQNLYGILKRAATSQDHLPLTEKRTLDWSRSRVQLKGHNEHAATLAFHMDGAIAFIPLTHSHMFLQDAAACSSLDFALRFFENDLDFNQWHLREIRTVVGSSGRTYGLARLFDESGKLVAEMSQQGILRPRKDSKPSL